MKILRIAVSRGWVLLAVVLLLGKHTPVRGPQTA